MNGLKIFERTNAREVCGPVEAGARRSARRNREIKDTLQAKEFVKCKKSLRLGQFGHNEKMRRKNWNTYSGRNKKGRTTMQTTERRG